MNIFATNICPIKSAQNLANVHVIKMKTSGLTQSAFERKVDGLLKGDNKLNSFICIGGPADGQWRTVEAGIYRLYVADALEACVTPYEQGTIPKNSDVKTHEYLLMKNAKGEIAWVHSDSIGE
mgnify:CR=1 FL=1